MNLLIASVKSFINESNFLSVIKISLNPIEIKVPLNLMLRRRANVENESDVQLMDLLRNGANGERRRIHGSMDSRRHDARLSVYPT